MPRALSSDATAALTARETGVIFLLAVEIEFSTTTLYAVSNTEDVSINSQTYTAVGFSLDMPEDTEDGFGTAKLTIDNTSQWLTPYLRNLAGPVTVTVRIVTNTDLTTDPPEFDNVEFESRPLRLRDVAYDDRTIRGTLYYNDTAKRRWPAYGFTPKHFKGLF